MTTRPTKIQERHDLWDWAAGVLQGSGCSIRSEASISPVIHLLTEGDRIWCADSPGRPFAIDYPRYCPECLRLAREMKEDLEDEE